MAGPDCPARQTDGKIDRLNETLPPLRRRVALCFEDAAGNIPKQESRIFGCKQKSGA
jgi:hypothetical protein